MNLDRPVIDLSWKVAHGVLYTADRLIGFGYDIDAPFFCNTALETPSHLFFSCPVAQSALYWLQSLMFSYSSSCPSLVCRHVLFGFAARELRSLPNVFIYVLNFSYGMPVMTFVLRASVPVRLNLSPKYTLELVSIFHSCLNGINR